MDYRVVVDRADLQVGRWWGPGRFLHAIYYNTDITPFTIQYLDKDPAVDPEIYAKTSPMTYIKQARTPTLIQHGEFDKRVPIPNAYELRQGLCARYWPDQDAGK